jgi:hypothetical protein
MGSSDIPGGNGGAVPNSGTIFVHPYQRERNDHLESVSGYTRAGGHGSSGSSFFADIFNRVMGIRRAEAQEAEPEELFEEQSEEERDDDGLVPINVAMKRYSERIGRPLTPLEEEMILSGQLRINNRGFTENEVQRFREWRRANDYLARYDPGALDLIHLSTPNWVPSEKDIDDMWSEAYNAREARGESDPWEQDQTFRERLFAGMRFDRSRKLAYPFSEVYIDKPKPGDDAKICTQDDGADKHGGLEIR